MPLLVLLWRVNNMTSTYLQNEAQKNFKDWTYEGLSFLLQQEEFKEVAITALSKLLELNHNVEFHYTDLYYEIFTSVESGYVVNLYSSNEKDEYGEYQDKFNVDGGLCTGTAQDAICFML